MPVPITSGNKAYNYFTKIKDAVQFVKDLANSHPQLIKIGSIGETQRNNNQISVLVTNQNSSDKQKLRVAIIGGIHGNEPISTDGLLFLIHQLTENPEYAYLLEHLEILIFPDVNVDGREADKRGSSNGIDLNRDLTSLNTVETRNLKKAINQFDPHVVLDFHEFNPGRSDFKGLNDCYSIGYDAMFLYTGNMNVDPLIRRMIAEDFVAPTKSYLIQNHREVSDYATVRWRRKEILLNMGGTGSRSSATNYALQNRISILMEIRGVTEGNRAVKRRIETSFLCATSYLRIADSLRTQVMATIDSANKRSIKGDRKIIVTSEPKMTQKPFLLVDECANEHKTIEFRTYDNVQQKPVITRERPGAYLIYPCSDKVKNVLTISGLSVKELDHTYEMDAEVYKAKGDGSFVLEKRKVRVLAGVVVVDAFQPMGNTLADLIEPEGANSMYSNGDIKTDNKTKMLPIYRISHEQLSKLLNL